MQSSDSSFDVFVSYTHRDASVAISIAENLRSYGLHPFVAGEVPLNGEQMEEAIWYAMAESNAFVLVVPKGVENAWIAFELGAAKAWNKRIYAISSDPTASQFVPGLRDINILSLARIDEIAKLIIEKNQPLSEEDTEKLAKEYANIGIPVDEIMLRPKELGKLVKRFNLHRAHQLSGEELVSLLLRLRKRGMLPNTGKKPRKKSV